ncbi:unnamed protein product [Protopolystoma xenopodis]|uniref:Uncharacterized protein n=1 Tax=Protopolystoma xenopodis TaxID=117903 RepID=A0A448WFU9_9PLAT|nr:unnamed protein product [Protopolystoma xenopodis]
MGYKNVMTVNHSPARPVLAIAHQNGLGAVLARYQLVAGPIRLSLRSIAVTVASSGGSITCETGAGFGQASCHSPTAGLEVHTKAGKEKGYLGPCVTCSSLTDRQTVPSQPVSSFDLEALQL